MNKKEEKDINDLLKENKLFEIKVFKEIKKLEKNLNYGKDTRLESKAFVIAVLLSSITPLYHKGVLSISEKMAGAICEKKILEHVSSLFDKSEVKEENVKNIGVS